MYGQFLNKNNGKCLDVNTGYMNTLRTSDCDGTKSQKWKYDKSGGRMMSGVGDGRTVLCLAEDNNNFKLDYCDGTSAQRFDIV